MTAGARDQARDEERHEGVDGEVPRAPEDTTKPYPPEADPGQTGDVAPAEVPGEQTDPGRRLTGGEQTVSDGGSTPNAHVTPGSTEPPD